MQVSSEAQNKNQIVLLKDLSSPHGTTTICSRLEALIDGVSIQIAIIVNFSMNVASVVVEYVAQVRPPSRFYNHTDVP